MEKPRSGKDTATMRAEARQRLRELAVKAADGEGVEAADLAEPMAMVGVTLEGFDGAVEVIRRRRQAVEDLQRAEEMRASLRSLEEAVRQLEGERADLIQRFEKQLADLDERLKSKQRDVVAANGDRVNLEREASKYLSETADHRIAVEIREHEEQRSKILGKLGRKEFQKVRNLLEEQDTLLAALERGPKQMAPGRKDRLKECRKALRVMVHIREQYEALNAQMANCGQWIREARLKMFDPDRAKLEF
jgi:chromosome segregation ATPase